MPSPRRFLNFLRAGRLVAGFALGWGVVSAESAKTDQDEAEAQAVFVRWIETQGGVQRVQRLNSMDCECAITVGAGLPPIEVHVRAVANGLYRYDFVSAVGPITQAFDGQIAWRKNTDLGFGLLSAQEHDANLGATDMRAPLRVWRNFTEHHLLPDETIAGRRVRVLGFRAGNEPREKWFFDAENGTRTRVEMGGADTAQVIEFSDYRKVQGGLEPFHTMRTQNGRAMEIQNRTLRYNDDVDPELFAAPTGLVEDNQRIERILWRNSQASGGAALPGLTSRVTKSLVEVTTSGLKFPTTISQKQPNLIIQEQDVPGMGKTIEGFDGQTGWAWSELQGYRVLQGAELQQLLATADLQGPLRLSAQCPFRKLLEEHEDNGRRIVGLALATMQGPAGNFYFDTETGHLVRIESLIAAGPQGQLKVVADFSDFRKVDGAVLPFVTIITNPAVRIVSTVLSVQHNTQLDNSLFRPKKE